MPCSPRMTKCKATCVHRAVVEGWYLLWLSQVPDPGAPGRKRGTTFKEWLRSHPYPPKEST